MRDNSGFRVNGGRNLLLQAHGFQQVNYALAGIYRTILHIKAAALLIAQLCICEG
jgi:hypothetical protein